MWGSRSTISSLPSPPRRDKHRRARQLSFVLLFLPFLALPLYAQNFPPVAKAGVTSPESWVDQPFSFSSAESIDPDESPQRLTFLWEFGDGTVATNANPSHTFAEPRAYRVSLTVNDGVDATIDTIVVHALARPTPLPPSSSSLVAIRNASSELWVANPDANTVSVINLASTPHQKIAEISTGRNPRTVAFSPNGAIAYVSCQDANQLWVFDAPTRLLLKKVAVGHQPYGVSVSPADGRILVSNQGSDSVMIIRSEGIVERVLPVNRRPRAIAISGDGTFAFISHFLTSGDVGLITKIDLQTSSLSTVSSLVEDQSPDTTSSGSGFPNMLSALAIHPSGDSTWFGGLKANTSRGLFANGERPTPENLLRGFFGKINSSNAFEELDRRIDANDTDSVSAIAFSSNGRYAYVTHQGAGTLSVYDISAATLIKPGDGNTVAFLSRVDVGHAPQGICISADGRHAYVANYLSRNLMVLDVSNPSAPALVSTIQTTAEPLSPNIANGKRLFYRSKEPRHSRANYIACTSCHADGGGHDGRTWDFTHKGEGLRNTTDLRGRAGLNHGPVHWTANFDEIQDFENDIVNDFGGTGLAQDGQAPNPPLGAPNAGRSSDLDDLADYVASLSIAAPSPHRKADETLSVAALRGKSLFNSSTLQCASCHISPRFTDSVLTASPTDYLFHDVGTLTPASGGRAGGTLQGIDTPSLIGLWDSAPYFHDGSASTLLEVLSTRNTNDLHGVTSSLTTNQRADLISYLRSIDNTTSDDSTDEDADGISDSWERKFSLNPFSSSDALLDFDGDGQNNLAEFLSGTDPTEPSSLLKIHTFRRADNETTFFFQTTIGTSYAAEYNNLLSTTNWLQYSTIFGDGAEQSVRHTNSLGSARFHRIRVLSNSN